MSNCTHCGKLNDLDARFCRFCGNPLSNGAGESVPRQEVTISVPVGVLHPEMVITSIGWWMVVIAIATLQIAIIILAFSLSASLETSMQATVGSELGRSLLSRAEQVGVSLVSLLGWFLLFVGMLDGTSATGLFRGRRWASGLAKAMMVVHAVLSLLPLALVPSPSTILGSVIIVGTAVVGWAGLSLEGVRTFFRD